MRQDGSTLVLFRDNAHKEVFLVFRSDYPIWVTTGGGIESGESSEKAALREAFEETGFRVKIIRFVGLYRIQEGGKISYKSYLFEGRVVSGRFKPEFPGCRGRWFKVDKLPLSMTDRTKEKIFDCIKYQTKEFKKIARPLSLKNNLHLLLLHPLAVARFIFKSFKT